MLQAVRTSRIAVRGEMPRGVLPRTILELDLSRVRGKLIERASGREKISPPIRLDRIDPAVADYRKFLYLNLKYQNFPVAPSYDIDEVWHQHVLFTRQYHPDCVSIFGQMLHHVPHFGRAERNEEEDTRILDNTRGLWVKEFGIVPASYEGMTVRTSDGAWSGNVDLSVLSDQAYWNEQRAVLLS